jgi:hypothetical protein
MKTSLAIVALVATSIGLGTALPAFAQTAPAAPPAAPAAAAPADQDAPHRMMHRGMGQHRMVGPNRGMARGMGPAALFQLACSDKGSEALEIALVRMSHRLDLTADQQALFDTFRTKALTTETSFADSCKASRPDRTADAKPDALTRLKSRLTIEQARLAAMNEVLPDFEALFNSLSDKQKADLLPHRGWGMGRGWGHDRGGMNRDATPPAPPQNS